MKNNLSNGLLLLSGIIAVTYLTLPRQTGHQQSVQASEQNLVSGKNIILAKGNNSETELLVKKAIPTIKADQIWQAIAQQQAPETLPENVSVEYIKVADSSAFNFSEGQQVSFLIPQENKSYQGTVSESNQAFGGKVKISSGDIENGSELASFSITEAENTTFVTVATGESIYQVEINNRSGVGFVLDDRELDQYRNNEDGILPPPEGVS